MNGALNRHALLLSEISGASQRSLSTEWCWSRCTVPSGNHRWWGLVEETKIYRSGSDDLDRLLKQTGPADATLWIPDLQRPFRWSPAQVTRLLDTLLRRWPFGTLLLWKVDDQHVAEVPARTFWRRVDRVDADEGLAAGRKEPPNAKGYRMVLDGQQRLQSLVVALCGDDSGFRLEDREWWESVDAERVRGRPSRHWSRGALCLDLDEYGAQRAHKEVQHVDYTTALKWVVCSLQGGRSTFKPPSNYEFPIPAQADHPGKFIRLSRLWDLARPQAPNVGGLMAALQNELLPEHGVSETRARELVPMLLDLVLALGQVKNTEVSYLELQPFQKGASSADQYDDAVVNIFTRLNAGGIELTEEEITFAWIKRHWKPAAGESPQATNAFEELRSALADHGLEVTTDKVVHAVSVVWAVIERTGKILRPSDLLNGKVVGPLAEAVSVRWRRLADNFVETAKLLAELDLSFRQQYESLNAFIVLASWRFVAMEWLAQNKAKTVVEHNVEARVDDLLRTFATRFLVLSAWAGDWAGTGGSAFAKYTGHLAEEYAAAKTATEKELVDSLEKRLRSWVTDAQPGAEVYLRGLSAGRREDVRFYFVPLWIWHRLSNVRRSASEGLNLRKSRAKSFIDVDHIVAFAAWNERRAAEAADESWANDVNQLGNCFLLEKNFNISKTNKPLGDWLAQIDQYAKPDLRAHWAAALDLADQMIDSGAIPLVELRALIDARTARVKGELLAFVRDEARLPPPEVPVNLAGQWLTAFEETNAWVDAPMVLRQQGEQLTGTYGEGGTIEGTVDSRSVTGRWTEPGSSGAFRWNVDEGGGAFAGTWGTGKKQSGRGGWRGKRE